MKRYLKDFEFNVDFIERSIYECLQNKWERNDVNRFLAHFAQIWLFKEKKIKISYTNTLKLVKKQVKIDKSKLFDVIHLISEELYLELVEKRIKLPAIKYDKRTDRGSGKIRDIGIQSFKQQCCDYIAVNACKKMFFAKIGHYQCASLINKGQLFGKEAIETWIRTNPKKCKWVFKCDVKKFYPSVSHSKLKELLARDIKNDTVLYLLFTLIDTYKDGLCIGSYLSQYLANYYLSYAYHYISEFLYVERRGKRQNLIHHVLFYMDDILLLGSSKKHVKMASKRLEEYLNTQLLLELKPTYQLFPLDSRPIDMLGYKIYSYKTIVRDRIFKKANKAFNKIKRNGFKTNLNNAYKVVSYYGYFKHTDSKRYIKKVKLNKIVQISKEVVSNASKNRV